MFDVQMVPPEAVLAALRIDEASLLGLVNDGLLPAYLIGEHLRFRAIEVASYAASNAA